MQLPRDVPSEYFEDVVLERRMITRGQHAIYDGPFFEGGGEGFGHVAEVFAGDGNVAVEEAVEGGDDLFGDFGGGEDGGEGYQAGAVESLDLGGGQFVGYGGGSAVFFFGFGGGGIVVGGHCAALVNGVVK